MKCFIDLSISDIYSSASRCHTTKHSQLGSRRQTANRLKDDASANPRERQLIQRYGAALIRMDFECFIGWFAPNDLTLEPFGNRLASITD